MFEPWKQVELLYDFYTVEVLYGHVFFCVLQNIIHCVTNIVMLFT